MSRTNAANLIVHAAMICAFYTHPKVAFEVYVGMFFFSLVAAVVAGPNK